MSPASLRSVVAVFVVTRVALALTVLAAISFIDPATCPFCRSASANPLLSALSNWDGAAYLDIARLGYPSLDPSYAAFFPLYPLLISVAGLLGGTDAYIVAGLIVSNVACFAAAVMLPELSRVREDGAPLKAASYLLIFPTTIFLSALYADSLFIALAIASALAARRGRWWASGALGAGAALTRPFGILVVVPLAIALWQKRAGLRLISAIPLALPPLAVLAWVLYLYALTGDPLAVVHGYTSGFTPRHPLQAFTDLLDPSVYGFPWFVAVSFALFVALTVYSWRVAGMDLAAYATAMMILIVAAGSLTSSLRYELSVYPAFIALATLTRWRGLYVAWSAISALLAIMFAGMFALYYWVG